LFHALKVSNVGAVKQDRKAISRSASEPGMVVRKHRRTALTRGEGHNFSVVVVTSGYVELAG